ncbi:MAG: hypothetical protein K0S65_2317 [Labilithrix sp.]|nr:hypothetical protein [Labilithrix sp.]
MRLLMVRWTSSLSRSSAIHAFLVLATLATLFVSGSASAEDKRVSLHYAASAACPSESEFVDMVRGFTQRWSLVAEGASADLTIDVEMSSRPSEIRGSLAVTNAGSSVSRRDIAGPNCTEVSEALAVMVAVLLDPRAGVSSERTFTESPPASETQADEPPPPPETTTRPEASSPSPVMKQEPAPPPPRRARETVSVTFDLRFETTSAVVRGSLPGLGASFALAVPSTEGPRWLRALKPSIGIGIRQSLPKERALPRGNVELLWTAAGVRLCPLSFALGTAVELSPCGEMNVGVLRASASGLADARSVATNWLDVGGAIWASVALSKTFFLSSTVLVTMPFNRQPFITDSGMPVASVPPLGVLGGVGVGAKMWSF